MKKTGFWIKILLLFLLWGVLLPRFVKAQPGSPDPAFGGGDGFTTTVFFNSGHSYPYSIALQPDGRIVVAGETWVPDGVSNSNIAIARYMPNGALDPTFNGDGKATIALPNMSIFASDILVLPGGKFLCAGVAWNETESFSLLSRINADGTPDTSFDGDGTVITKVGISHVGFYALAQQPDGKIIVAGNANMTGYDEFALLRYKSDGTLDNSFGGGDGIATTPVGESYAGAYDLMLQPDGKIVAIGYAVTNGFEDFAVARYNANGTLDATFGGGDGIVITPVSNKNDRATGVVLQPDGKITVGGYSGQNGSATTKDFAAIRLTTNGSLDPTFGQGDGIAVIDISDYNNEARAIALQPDGKILLGGNSRYNPNAYHFAVVRLTSGGIPDNTFDDDGIATLPTSATNDIIESMALQSDGKVVVTGTSWIDGYHHFGVARLLTGLTVDTTLPQVFSEKPTVYPNPVREQATLEYHLNAAETITLNLYDLQGRFIQNVMPETEKTAGHHVEALLLDKGIPSGTYMLVLETPNGKDIVKLVF